MSTLASGKRTPRTLISALILALVLSQTLALAHQHAHGHPASHDCALFLYAQHAGNSIPSTPFHLSPVVSGFVAALVSVFSLTTTISLPFLSRAPPVASR